MSREAEAKPTPTPLSEIEERLFLLWWKMYGQDERTRSSDESREALLAIKNRTAVEFKKPSGLTSATDSRVEEEQTENPVIRDWAKYTETLFVDGLHWQSPSIYGAKASSCGNEVGHVSRKREAVVNTSEAAMDEGIRPPCGRVYCDACIVSPNGFVLHATSRGQTIGGLLLEVDDAQKLREVVKLTQHQPASTNISQAAIEINNTEHSTAYIGHRIQRLKQQIQAGYSALRHSRAWTTNDIAASHDHEDSITSFAKHNAIRRSTSCSSVKTAIDLRGEQEQQ